jgi:hypothetical protein
MPNVNVSTVDEMVVGFEINGNGKHPVFPGDRDSFSQLRAASGLKVNSPYAIMYSLKPSAVMPWRSEDKYEIKDPYHRDKGIAPCLSPI